MNRLTCFKAYDIRGKVGEELNEDIAYRIGRGYGEFIKPLCVIVGGDVRLSSETLKLALANGLQDAGADVYDIGVSGSEEVYFATCYLGMDGGVEVTASHNPMNFNGMKLVRANAAPISSDTGLLVIKKLVQDNAFHKVPANKRGCYQKITILHEYVNCIMSYIDTKALKPMKLVINSGNGAAGYIIDEVERRFKRDCIPVTFMKVHHQADGNFPNGIPNPLLPACRDDTAQAVLMHEADMGIAFDGDFDRCFLFDEKGNFIEGYYIVGLLGEAFLHSNPGAKIIHDSRLFWNTIDIVKKEGGVPVMSKTGHSFMKERMRKEDAIYGGEMSAHHYFRDFFYCDSGMIPWLMVAALLSAKGKTLSQLVSGRIQAYPVSGEINRDLTDAYQKMQYIRDMYEHEALRIDLTDGIGIEFQDWRFNIRTSNTEPLVRLNVESKRDSDLVDKKTKEILKLLGGER
ncbi:Phosphomannomutase [Serratia symbiotica]|nr:Phosphomannomutase [Serratia symbiotica]